MKKIIWLSNVAFSNQTMRSTGTWITAMAEALLKTHQIKIYNISQGDVNTFERRDCSDIIQWIIPRGNVNKKGLLSKKIVEFLRTIEAEIKPDIIHIWGTEGNWGMLGATNVFSNPVLLEMQGILFAYERVFYGGLSFHELLNCIGLKELLLPKRLFYFKRKDFRNRGKIEKFVIKNSSNISVQSEWVKNHIKLENPEARIYDTGILLRNEFYNTNQWNNLHSTDLVIFTSSSGSNMYKGLHVLMRAIAVLKKKYPNIKLHIAGNIIYNSFLQDGYSNWLMKEAKNLEIIESIVWLGSLSVNEIITQLKKASVFVVPSYVETYCLALAEAMIIGTPCVASYAGAMPELAIHNDSALYFPVGDFITCASQIEAIITNHQLAQKLSNNGRIMAMQKNNQEHVVEAQLTIYNNVISNSKCTK